MKTFKNILIIFLLFLLPYIFFYLCASFVCIDFNFANWRLETRVLLVIMSSSCSIAILMLYFLQPTQNELNNFYK